VGRGVDADAAAAFGDFAAAAAQGDPFGIFNLARPAWGVEGRGGGGVEGRSPARRSLRQLSPRWLLRARRRRHTLHPCLQLAAHPLNTPPKP